MTFERIDGPNGRTYATPKGQVPSVTRILDSVPKPHLQQWYATQAARAALSPAAEHLAAHAGEDAAVKWAAQAAPRSTRGSAEIGTAVHNLAEHLIRGTEPTTTYDPPTEEDRRAYDASCANLRHALKELGITSDSARAEFGVYSPQIGRGALPLLDSSAWDPDTPHAGGYAGTADVLYTNPSGEVCLLDIKTSRKGAYTSAAWQLAAYATARRVVFTDGEEQVDLASREAYGNRLVAQVLSVRPDGWTLHRAGTYSGFAAGMEPDDELAEASLCMFRAAQVMFAARQDPLTWRRLPAARQVKSGS